MKSRRMSVDKADMERGGSERITKLRKSMLVTPQICIERGYLLTESYKETESDPVLIRRAKALDKILKNMTVFIDDGELIVGRTTSKVRGGALVPEVRSDWYLEEMDTFSTRDWDKYAPLTEEEKLKMQKIIPYWEGKALYDKWCAMIPESALSLDHKIQSSGGFCENGHHYAHVAVDYERVVTRGLKDVKEQVEEELEKLNLAVVEDFEKYQFLTAAHITLEAADSFAKRYADLAVSMAQKETDVHRKAELKKIADVCSRVPENPAESFYEALQSVWFIYVVLMVEGWGAGMSLGRPDQYLYPFYKKDLEENKITEDEVRELIALLYIKMNGSIALASKEVATVLGGFPIIQGVTLGGLTKDGRDAVNELSYLFLDAEKEVGLSGEDIVIRVHKNTPDAFLIRACEVAKQNRGKLKFISDDTVIQQLLSIGIPIDHARGYILTGCNSPVVPAVSFDLAAVTVNLPLMLELALNNGMSRLTGEQIGPQTGDPRTFTSYDEAWNAYKKQVEALIKIPCLLRNLDKQVYAEFTPCPFQSSLYNGCIEKGRDITNGGTAPYMAHTIAFGGAPNVGDSLAAIKKAVFEDKKLTMDRLIDALDKNFEGEEEVLHILGSAPKFGNDDDYVDTIVNDVLMHASNEVKKYPSFAGAKPNTAAVVVTANVPLGKIVGALPDGRKAGEPIAEGGVSPHQGRNVSGPTATMRSVTKLDQQNLSAGSVLNMRFNPAVLKDEAKMRKFSTLVRTFCETGGSLVQFNIVDTDMLREAQRHPEKHRDLLVRVATYSAYFVELSPELQNDIIARMEFEEI
jgi:pyruvate formate-lyase/glycerol dehydratase family glycyl radical enzyme